MSFLTSHFFATGLQWRAKKTLMNYAKNTHPSLDSIGLPFDNFALQTNSHITTNA